MRLLRSMPPIQRMARWEARQIVPGGRGRLPLVLVPGRSAPTALGALLGWTVLRALYAFGPLGMLIWITGPGTVEPASAAGVTVAIAGALILDRLSDDLAARRRLGIGRDGGRQPETPTGAG